MWIMENKTERLRIPVAEGFFCDGHCYVLTSSSFGGSGLAPDEVSRILFEDEEAAAGLIRRGVVFPVCFEGDCALDENSWVVVGDLTPEEERGWIARLRWKLNIPCGTFALVCSGTEEELERVAERLPPERDYEIYQLFDVPPGEYLVEIYAFYESLTVQVSLDEYDAEGFFRENEELAEWYRENRPAPPDTEYVIRLAPLAGDDPPLPELTEGRFETFEFRPR